MPSIAGISAAASFSLHSSMIKETANSGAFTGHFGLEYFSGVHFQRTDKRIQNLQFGVSLEVSTLSDCCRRASLSENRRRCVSEAAEVIWRKQNRVKEWP